MGRYRVASAAVAAVLGLNIGARAWACDYDLGEVWQALGLGDTPSAATPSPDLAAEPADLTLNTAPISAWKVNFNGATGSSLNSTINSYVSQEQADVQQVWYDNTYVYVKHNDVPSHLTGRADNSNPAYASSQNKTSRITLTPTEAASKTNTSLGAIGVMVNGAYFYNAWDAHSYNNQNIWQQNANTVEAVSFDTGPGHAAPGQNAQPSSSTPGQYHYHQAPTALLNQIDAGNTGQRHSPILGYAFDGFPIYGPYGYVDPTNPNSGIKRITSSYQVRADISSSGLRHSTTDGGSTLPTNQWGPNVSTQYPAGYYLQDYEYVSGLGDLNQYNMRWTVTPDYPQGTWAYFVTLDNSGAAAYPYIVGPQYFGVVDSADIGPTGGQVAIPGSARELTLGDADLDGTVDGADLAALASHWQGHADWAGGDFNRDGIVDITDLYLLAQNWQGAPESMSQLLAAVEAQSSVPEPGLAMGMLLPMLLITRRRGSHNSTRRE